MAGCWFLMWGLETRQFLGDGYLVSMLTVSWGGDVFVLSPTRTSSERKHRSSLCQTARDRGTVNFEQQDPSSLQATDIYNSELSHSHIDINTTCCRLELLPKKKHKRTRFRARTGRQGSQGWPSGACTGESSGYHNPTILIGNIKDTKLIRDPCMG